MELNPVAKRVLKKLAWKGRPVDAKEFQNELLRYRITAPDAKYFMKGLRIKNGRIVVD